MASRYWHSGQATLSRVFGLAEQPGLGILVHTGQVQPFAFNPSTRTDT